MTAWIPTIVTLLVTILAAVAAPDWVAAHPVVAAVVAGIYAIVKGLLPSPVAPKPQL
jgi:hypothetical protein